MISPNTYSFKYETRKQLHTFIKSPQCVCFGFCNFHWMPCTYQLGRSFASSLFCLHEASPIESMLRCQQPKQATGNLKPLFCTRIRAQNHPSAEVHDHSEQARHLLVADRGTNRSLAEVRSQRKNQCTREKRKSSALESKSRTWRWSEQIRQEQSSEQKTEGYVVEIKENRSEGHPRKL